jgi:hypothetical protein
MSSKRAPITLLCAATGTGLSHVLLRLARGNRRISDLETILCESYRGDPQLAVAPDEVPRMEVVARKPRSELHARWKSSAENVVSTWRENPSDISVLGMHLSWYNSSTSEFYSPVDVSPLLDVGVNQVIVLIDDIYDMFSRLQGKNDIYDPRVIASHIKQLSKFSYSGVKGAEGFYDLPVEQKELRDAGVRSLVTEAALSQLLSWRRAEMFQAENLACVLGCESLTLLAAKHSFASLEALIDNPGSPRTYLSHRISEPRRMNLATAQLPDSVGVWAPVAKEVNRLHVEFARRSQLLINPTAIDELRFSSPTDIHTISAFLGARWPLPEPTRDLLVQPLDDYEHTRILVPEGCPAADSVLSGVVRSLSGRIFFEIAYRDHYVVEHTPHFLIYRPFFCENSEDPIKNADWSGGVHPELRHWLEKSATPGLSGFRTRRLAVVHTDLEIRDRLRWMREPSNFRSMFVRNVQNHFFVKLKTECFPDDEISRLREGSLGTIEASHLELNMVQFTARRSREVFDWIRSYGLAALHQLFTDTSRPHRVAGQLSRIDVALVTRHEDSDRNLLGLADLVDPLTRFFAGDADSDSLNEGFWEQVSNEFLSVFGKSITEASFEAVNIDMNALAAMFSPVDA